MKITKNARSPRKNALWVKRRYHKIANMCAQVLEISAGEFVEKAIKSYINRNRQLRDVVASLDDGE